MKGWIVYVFLFFAWVGSSSAEERFLMAFGSCSKAKKPQLVLAEVVKRQPDLFCWIGDIVYADTGDPKKLAKAYGAQLKVPAYQDLLKTCPVIGTYDDHDYGVNNGGKEFSGKEAAQTALLDFLGVTPDDPRRQRKGVYSSWMGFDGKVKVLLLDTRYHRDRPSAEGDVLGEEQWKWLKTELDTSEAEVNVVVSSIQFLPTEHRYEKWANFPASRTRLLDLLSQSPAKKIVVLSGDRHFAELSSLVHRGRRIWEITASGMTHSWWPEEPNRLRVGKLWGKENAAFLDIRQHEGKVEVLARVMDDRGVDRIVVDLFSP